MQKENKRVELLIFKNKKIEDFLVLQEKYAIINVYIKVELSDLSKTRENLIKLNYTTRLFITYVDGKKEEYIFGKLKKSKGVFKEHCKNSLIKDNIEKVINISSEVGDYVIIDNRELKGEEDRKWIII